MSASENQAAETSKDSDDSKVDRPWNIIHIRLPPRKRLSDASLVLSKKVPGNTSNTGSKEVPEPITDDPGKDRITAPVQSEANSHSPRAILCNEANSNIMIKSDPGKDRITAPVQSEANSHSPRAILCNEANSNIMIKSLSAESESDSSGNKLLDGANVSSLRKNLRAAAEEQRSDASSYAAINGLCEEANKNNPSMILLLPVQELPENNFDSSPSKNHATTRKHDEEEECNNSLRKKLLYNEKGKLADEKGNSPNWNITITAVKYEELFEGANHPTPIKLSDEVKNNAPSIRPTDLPIKSTPHKSLRTSSVQATGTIQNTPGMNLAASVGQSVEQSINAANIEDIKIYQEFEVKIQRNVYLENLSHQATEAKTNPSRTLSTTGIEFEVFEHANHPIPTKKMSDVARNNSPSNRPTEPAKKSTPRKKPCTSAVQATGTSQNTYGMKFSTSDGQGVNQSKSSVVLEAIKQYPEQTNITRCKEVPKLMNENPGMNLITAPEQGETSNLSPRVGLCDGASSNTLTKTPSAESQASGDKLQNEANDSTPSKNLRVAAEEQGSYTTSYAGPSEKANNNIPSMLIPVAAQKLPEDHIDNSRSKNLTTTGKQGKDEQNKSPTKKMIHDTDSEVEDEKVYCPSRNPIISSVNYENVFEEANHPIFCKKLLVSDEAKNNGPSNEPTDSANNRSVYKRRRTSSIQATGTSQNTSGTKRTAFVGQAVEQSTNTANMNVLKVYREFEKNIQRTVYLDNLSHQATKAKTNPSRKLSMTAIECEVSEHANHLIPTKKSSDVARNKAPSSGPTNPAKKSIPRKKPRTSSPVEATSTSHNTSTMKISTSDGQAVNESKSTANLEAVKQYQEFEEKVKRTVYLDNLSHQATEEVIKAALSQFCTIRKVSFVVNYTIPYNIPQCALIELETEKDAKVVLSMLHDFPFMMYGMPRPVRAIHATAEMFNDRLRRSGSKLKFCWVKNTDPDYAMVKRLKLLSRKHEVENLALIEHELEEEKLLAAKQQENLNVNYKMMETMDSVLLSGMSNYLSKIYNVSWNDVF